MRNHSSGGRLLGPAMVTSEWRDGTTMLIAECRFASRIADSTATVISSSDRRMILRCASILSSAVDLRLGLGVLMTVSSRQQSNQPRSYLRSQLHKSGAGDSV